MLELTVTWQDNWKWWHRMYPSRYAKGTIQVHSGLGASITSIYRHKKSGQIRVYSDSDLDGRKLKVNDEKAVTLELRGSAGKLYIGDR